MNEKLDVLEYGYWAIENEDAITNALKWAMSNYPVYEITAFEKALDELKKLKPGR